MTGLGDLPGWNFHSQAYGISADGSTIVGVGDSSLGFEAFIWTEGVGMVGLGGLSSDRFYSTAFDISANGSTVVGVSTSALGNEAFVWTQTSGMIGLGDLPGGEFAGTAHAISADGLVIVGSSSSANSGGGMEAFRWTESRGMVGLGDLPGGDFLSQAYGVSADGSTVVGLSNTATATEAFIWDDRNGMRPLGQVLTELGLDLTGWTLNIAFAISDDGRTIVGEGTNPSGNTEAWIAPIPEPSTALLLACGLLELAVRGKVAS